MNGVIRYKSQMGHRSFRWPRLRGARGPFFAGIAALMLAATASAATVPPQWTPKDAAAAVKALHLNRPHAKTTTCKGLGAPLNGMYAKFRCRTLYPHHRRRTLYLQGRAEGGWLCAGTTMTGCKLLNRGFVSTGQAARYNGLDEYVTLSATGYAENHGDANPTKTASCTSAGTNTWTCGFASGTVTITYKTVKGGWLVTGS